MKYTKQIITKLLEDKTTDNDFINQLRGLALLAKDETVSNSARTVSYASPALSGVQNGGNVLEEAVKKEMELIITNRDKFIKAFVAETGLHPSECEMIEQRINTPTFIGAKIYFQKKTK